MTSQATIGTLQHIRCGWGNQSYALGMSWVRSIERADRLRRDPGPDGREGWLPSREGDLAVFSLAKRLGQPGETASAQGRILVLNPPPFGAPLASAPKPWGLLVERVSRVNQITTDHIAPLPPIAVNPSARYFQGVIQSSEELVLLLAPDRLHPDAPSETAAAADSVLRAANPVPPARVPQNTLSSKQIVVFSTTRPPAGERPVSFALGIGQVPEILDAIPEISVPGAPPFMVGLGNWRNRPVPIIDLNVRLGLPFSPDRSSDERHRILIAHTRQAELEQFGGLIVRSQIRTLQLPLAHSPSQRALPLELSLIRGMVELDDETLIIPNLQAIL